MNSKQVFLSIFVGIIGLIVVFFFINKTWEGILTYLLIYITIIIIAFSTQNKP